MFRPSASVYRAVIVTLTVCLWVDHFAAAQYQFKTRTVNLVPTETTLRLLSPPREVAVRVGQTASVLCDVDPRRPSDTVIKWRRVREYTLNDTQTSVSGSSTNTLRLHNMSLAMAARYECSIRSKLIPGRVMSRRVHVTVKSAYNLTVLPRLLRWPSEPANTSVAAFRCKAELPDKAHMPTIKWQVFSNRRWSALKSGSMASKFVVFQDKHTETSTLQILGPRREDIFKRFRCRTGSLTSQPGAFHLFAGPPTVLYPSPFFQRPRDVTVIAGHSVILPCATLYRDGEVSWRRRSGSSVELLTAGDRVLSQNVSIVGVSNLKIPSASIEMAGMYVCSVQVGGREAAVQAALIIHQTPKLVDKRWDSIIVTLYQPVNLTCIFSAWPPTDVVFMKEGIPIPKRFYSSTTTGGPLHSSSEQATWSTRPAITTTTLVFPSRLDLEMKLGSYQCAGVNKAGENLGLRRVDVEYPVSITRQPSPALTVSHGNSILLPCDAEGVPTSTEVSWFLNTTCVAANGDSPRSIEIPRKERRRFQLTETGSLNISNARHSDSGYYTCYVVQVDSPNPEVHSHPSFLTVTGDYSSPTIDDSQLPSVTTLHAGDRLKLHCAASGFPEPKVEWRYLGAEGSCPSIQSLRVQLSRPPRKLTPFEELLRKKGVGPLTPFKDDGQGNLVIPSARPSHVGRYACVAHNALGTTRRCLEINLEDPPTITDPTLEMVDNLRNEVLKYVLKEIRVHCGADGNPTPRVRWTWAIVRQNGSVASAGTTAWGQGLIVHTLKLPADTLYVNKTCHVENKFGKGQRAVRFMFKKQPMATDPKPTERGATKPAATTGAGRNNPETKPFLVKENQDSEKAAEGLSAAGKTDTTKIYIGLTVAAALVLLVMLVIAAVVLRRRLAAKEEQRDIDNDIEDCAPTDRKHPECADSADRPASAVRPECRRQSSISSSGDREQCQSTGTTSTVCPDSVSLRSSAVQRPTFLWPASGTATPGPTTPVFPDPQTPRTPMIITIAPSSSSSAAAAATAAPTGAAAVHQEHALTRSPIPVSHKRSSFFDFNASCNQIPEGEANGDAHLEPCHAKQASSSWAGVTSPLQAEVVEDQEDYEEMKPVHGMELCSKTGGAAATSPPMLPPLPPKSGSLGRQYCGSCPNLPADIAMPATAVLAATSEDDVFQDGTEEETDI